MDIYAQPQVGAPVVWMQQAPHDPKRRKVGLLGTYTSYGDERGDSRGTIARWPHAFSTPIGGGVGSSKKENMRTSGVSQPDSGSIQPSWYATGDLAQKNRSTNTPASTTVDDEIARISDQRVKLLAVRYEQPNTSAEILARLTILDTRLAEKAPRVSQAQLDVLEQNLDMLVDLRRNREMVASKLAALANR